MPERNNVHKNKYANFTPKDFNKHNCLTLSLGVYGMLLYILRAYVVWIMSIVNQQNPTSFVTFIYPQTSLFYLSLTAGGIGVFILVIISLRRPGASIWLQKQWQYCNYWFLFALGCDLACMGWGYNEGIITFISLMLHAFIVLVCCLYVIFNQRFKLNLMEFPEKFLE